MTESGHVVVVVIVVVIVIVIVVVVVVVVVVVPVAQRNHVPVRVVSMSVWHAWLSGPWHAVGYHMSHRGSHISGSHLGLHNLLSWFKQTESPTAWHGKTL